MADGGASGVAAAGVRSAAARAAHLADVSCALMLRRKCAAQDKWASTCTCAVASTRIYYLAYKHLSTTRGLVGLCTTHVVPLPSVCTCMSDNDLVCILSTTHMNMHAHMCVSVQVCGAVYYASGAPTIRLPLQSDNDLVRILRACVLGGTPGAPAAQVWSSNRSCRS